MASKQQIKRLKELANSRESPSTGWCPLKTRKFLKKAVRKTPPDGVIVEIGTWRGKATAVMALECLGTKRKIYTVDPYKDYVVPSGVMASKAIYGKHTFEDAHKGFNRTFKGVKEVELLHCTSEEAAQKWDYGEIDFLYLDGDLRVEMIRLDLALWVPKIKKGGVVSGHDWDRAMVQEAVTGRWAGKDRELKIAKEANVWWFHV